ncbi:methyltransferase domain-containing protein [Nonomuraea fuscirosea]|uniref:methyltransferase domain-containing protein n=1 Tax=Nonomuraea fuscirosea TaxID=1291556 RepID=UPI002DDBCBA2|nr:methyltransferase domain-containing protein [Nonomuraea fuscirosea]WSA57341.1 methyltransferase domain-containing protein [Nonomuraea fuscirosea]
MTVRNGKRWNHNIHYHPRILRAVPDGAKSALDVGCGEGTLARELRRVVPHVTGIDPDAAVLGLARSTMPGDLPRELAAVAANGLHRATKEHWEHPSPTVWPPPVTYPEMRALAAEALPGSAYRRHLLWRYSIVWRKPRD